MIDDHYRDIVHLLNIGYALEGFSRAQKNQLIVKVADFQLVVGQLYNMGPHEILCHYVLEHERPVEARKITNSNSKGFSPINVPN